MFKVLATSLNVASRHKVAPAVYREAMNHEIGVLEVVWHLALQSRLTPSRKGIEPHRSLAGPAPVVANC